MITRKIDTQGFCTLPLAMGPAVVDRLRTQCNERLRIADDGRDARSSRGLVYAARNVIDAVPDARTVWRGGILESTLRQVLGGEFGLVRGLFFDKPPDRTWSLPWHKDTAIAVADNSLPSPHFSRPTVKAGVPHVVASDDILRRMLTLRIHLDDVTDENGPLKVIPGSHHSKTAIRAYPSSPSLGRFEAEERGFGEGMFGFGDCEPIRLRRDFMPEQPPPRRMNEYSNRRCFAIARPTASASCSTSLSLKRRTSQPCWRRNFSRATSCSPV